MIVSYGTAFWYVEETSGSHVGLWQKCVGNPLKCVGINLEYSGTNGELLLLLFTLYKKYKYVYTFDMKAVTNRIRDFCSSLQ